MLDEDNAQKLKMEEKELSSGVVVEYFCTVGGPSIEDCMNQVTEIAVKAIIRNQMY